MSLQPRKITIDKIEMLVMAGATIAFMMGFAVAVQHRTCISGELWFT